jgi:transcriptional regulator with XRE-family HTH domain
VERIDIRVRIGLRIKQLRANAGLTQDQLAYAINLSRSYLAEVETGKRNISIVNLERICDGLQVSLTDFFADELFEQ